MNATPLTLVGNLVDDPELRFTPSGACVANFRVASTPRRFDKQQNSWVDGEALFMTCSVWREQAENVAETLTKGMRVVVTGKLRSRSYETATGERRTVVELDVDEVAPSLKYATAQVSRRGRGSADASGRPSAPGRATHSPRQPGAPVPGEGAGQRRPPRSDDPWATVPPAQWPPADQRDEPPF